MNAESNKNHIEIKNTSKRNFDLLFDQESVSLLSAENSSAEDQHFNGMVTKGRVHFYFCLSGKARFLFGPHYAREIAGQYNYFFYNPEKDLPFEIILSEQSRMVELSISLAGLHNLFTHDAIPFLKPENAKTKFYDERQIPAALFVVLNQLFSVSLDENALRLYYHAKAYEILSLYFSGKKPDTENCPFLNNEETIRKIKNAKEYLLKNANAAPGLKELAKFAGLNEYQLKEGFKEIYGNTVYGYLLDHKLDHARVLLDTGKYQVAEVAYEIGYTNPSHFIAAFKKKFGVTPKKYLMGKAGRP
ncbi:MAG: helix-turn-helix transcriptional regulator [Bacteroidetes bacterium]|nr:helix-turn-helix transcriptional regulator [Bacteroidota bacterium]